MSSTSQYYEDFQLGYRSFPALPPGRAYSITQGKEGWRSENWTPQTALALERPLSLLWSGSRDSGCWGGGVFIYYLVLFVQCTASCYDMPLSCFAFEFCFYTTCRGTEVAMPSPRAENVDSVSVPKSKKKSKLKL